MISSGFFVSVSHFINSYSDVRTHTWRERTSYKIEWSDTTGKISRVIFQITPSFMGHKKKINLHGNEAHFPAV